MSDMEGPLSPGEQEILDEIEAGFDTTAEPPRDSEAEAFEEFMRRGYTPDPFPGSISPSRDTFINRPLPDTPADDQKREIEGE